MVDTMTAFVQFVGLCKLLITPLFEQYLLKKIASRYENLYSNIVSDIS